MTTQHPDDDLITCIMQADHTIPQPQKDGELTATGVFDRLVKQQRKQPLSSTTVKPGVIDKLSYALAKQVSTVTEVHSNYGMLPLDEADLAAVQKLLRQRLERKLARLNKQTH